MSVPDIIMLVIGCLAFIALIVCLCLYFYWKKKQRELMSFNKKEESFHEEDEIDVETIYSVNERLDGARVSHRREHADRKAQEAHWKEKKAHEIEEKERRHKEESNKDALMIFSPVSGEVDAVFDADESVLESDTVHAGMRIIPNEDKLYAPMSGIFHYDSLNGFRVVNEAGILVEVKIIGVESDKTCEMLLKDNMTVCAGECVGNIVHGLRNQREEQIKALVGVSGNTNGQLLLVKKVSFASHGDKIITINKL